ncbi:unnamed protein product [Paramecium pentaurelia]|uniref:Uncharacterized protein n=1 Tax=Paramecium pentaurelia TaxID=43138 RepID=A0A8S1X3Z7_9CILI|nr:unnamed protein product [Paramecium pentaurelia]
MKNLIIVITTRNNYLQKRYFCTFIRRKKYRFDYQNKNELYQYQDYQSIIEIFSDFQNISLCLEKIFNQIKVEYGKSNLSVNDNSFEIQNI